MDPHDPANASRHDVVIVGGGLVGTSLALALEPSGLDVAMVDRVAGIFFTHATSMREPAAQTAD